MREKRRGGSAPSALPAPSPRLIPTTSLTRPFPGPPVSQAHLFPRHLFPRHLRRGAEDGATSSAADGGRATSRLCRPRALSRPPGPSLSPPPHFLCGPAGGGSAAAPPGGRPGGQGARQAAPAPSAGREGPAGRAPGTWLRSLRHCPHLASRRPRDLQPSCLGLRVPIGVALLGPPSALRPPRPLPRAWRRLPG